MDNEFEKELAALLNRHSEDSVANTPDFILASYLLSCLMAFKLATEAREKWHGREPGASFVGQIVREREQGP